MNLEYFHCPTNNSGSKLKLLKTLPNNYSGICIQQVRVIGYRLSIIFPHELWTKYIFKFGTIEPLPQTCVALHAMNSLFEWNTNNYSSLYMERLIPLLFCLLARSNFWPILDLIIYLLENYQALLWWIFQTGKFFTGNGNTFIYSEISK